MSIDSYYGTDRFTVSDATIKDVYEALDNMHTQVLKRIDRVPRSVPLLLDEQLLRWLSKTMDSMFDEFPLSEFD